jgi:hypothetical protein
MKFEETLCRNHNTVVDKLKRIRKNKKFTNEEINEILEIIYFAKKQGQRMENRLRKYKYAIEGLGFKRISK